MQFGNPDDTKTYINKTCLNFNVATLIELYEKKQKKYWNLNSVSLGKRELVNPLQLLTTN